MKIIKKVFNFSLSFAVFSSSSVFFDDAYAAPTPRGNRTVSRAYVKNIRISSNSPSRNTGTSNSGSNTNTSTSIGGSGLLPDPNPSNVCDITSHLGSNDCGLTCQNNIKQAQNAGYDVSTVFVNNQIKYITNITSATPTSCYTNRYVYGCINTTGFNACRDHKPTCTDSDATNLNCNKCINYWTVKNWWDRPSWWFNKTVQVDANFALANCTEGGSGTGGSGACQISFASDLPVAGTDAYNNLKVDLAAYFTQMEQANSFFSYAELKSIESILIDRVNNLRSQDTNQNKDLAVAEAEKNIYQKQKSEAEKDKTASVWNATLGIGAGVTSTVNMALSAVTLSNAKKQAKKTKELVDGTSAQPNN